jgi:hypothetical protein
MTQDQRTPDVSMLPPCYHITHLGAEDVCIHDKGEEGGNLKGMVWVTGDTGGEQRQKRQLRSPTMRQPMTT